MKADYGHRGTLGVLTPQANTTVEPELWTLLPSGWSLLNARLTSGCDSIEARLVDYANSLVTTTEQFSNAPVNAFAFACTGASYLIGSEEETRVIDEVEAKHNLPCITAARATATALKTMGAQKLALLSPYQDSLNEASSRYWKSHGFSIVERAGPALQNDAFHPIYAMTTEAIYQSYVKLSACNADAVLMLGTGMPTLASLLRGHAQGLTPAISCNLALAWTATKSVTENSGSLDEWLSGDHWRQRLQLIAGEQ